MSFGLGKLGRLGRLGVVSGRGTGGGSIPVQKDMYFSGKNAYIYACSKNGIKELHLYGHSEQSGIPAPDTPAEISSVGDSYLQLYVLDINHPDKGGQIFDFGDIKLRSLPNGVCDEIVYKDKQWRYIQRVNTINTSYISSEKIETAWLLNERDILRLLVYNIPSAKADTISCCNKASWVNARNPSVAYGIGNVVQGSNYNEWRFGVQGIAIDDPLAYLQGYDIHYELNTPIETVLDLPKIEFSSETIYLLTNEQTIKPYFQGYYDVDLKISGKKLEYVQDGLIGWWQSFGLNNVNKPTVIPDKLGNYDLTIRNLNYTNESGFHPTYLQFDGVDDNSNVKIERLIGHIQVTLSDLNDNSNRNLALLSNWAGSGSINITFNRNKLDISKQVADSAKGYINGEEVTSYNIVNGDGSIHTLAISNSKDGYNLHNISISGAFNSANNYFVKERFYEAIAYNRALSNEEVQNNFLVSKIRNGVNIPDSVDPIDIIAERTYASGKKFPVYNTYRDRDNDNIESFKIMGYTVQNGTPTPEAPVPLLSVGDEGLKLCISDSETGIALQTINFGDIVLRSVPGGACDSIEWDGTNWKHVQRIGYVKMLPAGVVGVFKLNPSDTYYRARFETNTYGVVSNDFKIKEFDTSFAMSNKFVYNQSNDKLNSLYLLPSNSSFVCYVITDKSTKEEFIELIGDDLEFIGELAEPITTIFEGIPAPQTFDEVTYFGTPSALVKPYMMCECKVKKALKYQGDISAWWYFGGNKSNETDRQIIDISGNGNDLTPYNFAWTRESGWNQGGIYGDGIDDTLISNKELSIKNILLATSEFENTSKTRSEYILGLRLDNKSGGLCINASDHILGVNNNVTSKPNNVPAKPLNYFLLTNNVDNKSNEISLFSYFQATGQFTKGKIHECLLFSSELTDEEFTNNIQLSKQRNGTDGDINIIPEPDVYYDFSLYNNTDFPSTIENLAADKSKALKLFNFAGTEESGFTNGALVSDGVDDYAVIQNDTEGFMTVFIQASFMNLNVMLYDQRVNGNPDSPYCIYTSGNSIAYNEKNPGGVSYINGVLNESILVKDLLNNKHIITIVNQGLGNTPYLFSNFAKSLFSNAKFFKFLGFKEALTAEQIQEVINQYFSKNLLADSNGDLLTDSTGYFLTSN